MGKLIFFDIDGTLIGRDGIVPQSTKEALTELKEQGHQLFLCSGRSKGEMPWSIRNLGFQGMVASAGAYVEYEGQVLRHRPIPEKDLRELLAFLEQYHTAVVLETNETAYLTEEGLRAFAAHIDRDNSLRGEAKKEFMGIFRVCEELGQIQEVNKLLYLDSECSLERIQDRFAGQFTVLPSSIQWNGKNGGEISEIGMTKAEGILCLLKHLNRGREDVIAVGDGLNDLEMLELAGLGIAMGNAHEKLKASADWVTDSVERHGIRSAFEQLGLIASCR